MPRVSPSITAFVTGASSGIGNEYARQLAARGHDLVVVARRRDRLEALRDELQAAHGVKVEPLVADLETEAGRTAVEDRLRAGGPWYVVNNAGFGTRGRLAELPVERETAEVMVNVVAMHRVACVAMQVNTAAGGGAIVNVASMAGFQPIPYFSTYAATKAFMLHFTEGMAVEARGTGVTVTALCPGPVRTEFIEGGFEQEEKLFNRLIMDVETCVAHSVRAVDRGQTVCVPGVLMRASTLAVPFIPRGLLRGATGRFQEMLKLDTTRESEPAAPTPAPRRRKATSTAAPRHRAAPAAGRRAKVTAATTPPAAAASAATRRRKTTSAGTPRTKAAPATPRAKAAPAGTTRAKAAPAARAARTTAKPAGTARRTGRTDRKGGAGAS